LSPRCLVASVLSTRSSQDRATLRKFREFLALNELEASPLDSQLGLIAAQMRSAGLKGTTIISYLYSILNQVTEEESVDRAVLRRCQRVLNTFEYAFRHDEVRRAPELASGDLNSLLAAIEGVQERVCCELMYVTALRVGDLCDVNPKEIQLHGNHVKINLVGGKNHRKFNQRDVVHGTVSDYVRDYLAQVKLSGSTCILRTTTKAIGDALTAAGRTLNAQRGHQTSYSLRNFRIMEIIEAETDGQRRVDWEAVRNTTKHRGTAALKSAYQWSTTKAYSRRALPHS